MIRAKLGDGLGVKGRWWMWSPCSTFSPVYIDVDDGLTIVLCGGWPFTKMTKPDRELFW